MRYLGTFPLSFAFLTVSSPSPRRRASTRLPYPLYPLPLPPSLFITPSFADLIRSLSYNVGGSRQRTALTWLSHRCTLQVLIGEQGDERYSRPFLATGAMVNFMKRFEILSGRAGSIAGALHYIRPSCRVVLYNETLISFSSGCADPLQLTKAPEYIIKSFSRITSAPPLPREMSEKIKTCGLACHKVR